ncbi:beta-lactamase class A [Pseudomonas duriflava]|uniref:Beta-lactamase n=1 Tax=Pseudomonas duriflava TaxID=459528 RepID=A0A562QL37_9PSED|nr:class A beta-lactamase [Pseudomonas duriflava]TWI57429.1 beta-lactamase class A [Pseudomonas duriflava]
MNSLPRRTFLLGVSALPLMIGTVSTWAAIRPEPAATEQRLARLEQELNGRLGVFAWDTGAGTVLRYRADERFPMNSTFKVMLAAAILAQNEKAHGLLEQHIRYTEHDLVTYSPITEKHLAQGMTIAELCAAAIQYSDNTAANLLMAHLGGPAAVTAFARSIDDEMFRLDRWETELNTAIPGDPRDTSTPEAMGYSLQRLALGDALSAASREQLQAWLRGNTTGNTRIRAGVPSDWQVGDKTGTGDYGTASDIAVLWPPGRAPMIIAIYTAQTEPTAKARNDVIASAARVVAEALG